MVAVCLYFHVHQPIHLRKDYTFFNIGHDHSYEDEPANREALERFADNCCLPANDMMLDLIGEFKEDFKIALSISGTTLEWFAKKRPEVIASFQRLARSGCVEFVNEPYYHSMAFLFSRHEFLEQAIRHREITSDLFGQDPTTFRNTEMIYNNDLAMALEDMGYATVLVEGADHVIGWRTANFVYQPVVARKIRVLARNYRLSECIAAGSPVDGDTPLSPAGFAEYAHGIAGRGEILNLFMSYDVFNERREAHGDIMGFFRALPREILRHPEFCFKTPADISKAFGAVARLDAPQCISWSGIGRNTDAWLGNSLQNAAVEYVFQMEKDVRRIGDPDLMDCWRRLQASDHFLRMCTKSPETNHSGRLSNHDSPYLAHIAYMNILNDLHERVRRREGVLVDAKRADKKATAPNGRSGRVFSC